MKGPLDLLRTSWLDRESEVINLPEWIHNVKGKLAEMAQVASEKEIVARIR